MSALNELQNYTFVSKYARWIEKENRRETWKEAVDRVKNMMHQQYADKNISEQIDWAYELMFKKRVLGSQRALQFGGEPILKRHAKIYNCTSSYCDRLRFFQECFWLLLCGSGTGFSVQKHHVAKLPQLSQNKKDKRKGVKYIIEDSIEGWADALGVLLSSYFNKPSEPKFSEYKDQYIVFDYSNIREKGAQLSSGVGKAPGFEPLQNGLEKIRELLDICVNNGQKKLRPIDAYDIVMHSSDAVLSGGVRRSASLALFSADDEEMAKAKTGNWYMENPQRARSNNSALLLKDNTSYEDFLNLMESVKEFGEPGFIWSDSTEMTFNPCVEVGMWPVDEKTGKSGWQGCNLSTINCSSVTDEDDFYERCKAAAIIGTLQAGFTDLDYLGEVSKTIFDREALLGVSLTGIMEKHDLVLTEKVLKAGAKIAVDTNKELSKKIGINQAARVTCLKPEGCLTKDTTIVTNDGILSLEEIGDMHGDQWQNLENTTIATDKINQKASKFFINGHKPTKKILTSGGIELESTLNHKFRVITDEGKYEWKTAEELSIGDILPYKIGTYTGGCEQELYIPDIQRSKHASRLNTNINLPNIIDENFAWFIGLYTGDGSNHPNKYSIRIHGDINKQEHLVKAQNYIRSIGIDTKIVKYNQDSNDVRCALYITSRIFYEFLQHNGLLKNKSHDISIPLNIRKSKSNIISAFIDGYASADGCTKGHTRSFCTTSKLMATQLVQCLRGIGIDCKTRLMPPTSTSYGSSMRYWIQERLGRSSKNVNKSQYSKYYQLLDQLGLYSFGVDFIVDIQDSSCDTYDISVEHEDHTYIANSYVSHNTSSSMLGTSSGIHPHHAKRYIRHVQANILEPPYQYFKSYNPQACEKSSWSANNTDEVIKFPIEVPDGSKLKNQLPAVEMLAIVKDTQKNWVQSGKNRSLCTQDYLCHNVSNTVTVKPDEWNDVTKYIYQNRKYFAGISLIPQSGDKDYPQAPFTTVYTSREIVKEYGDAALWCSGLIELGLNAFNNNLWTACDYITMNQETDEDGDDKKLFSLKMRRFAKKYFNDDIRRLTYCMKDVYNWKIYTDLYDNFVKVDYTQLLETEDNTVGIEEISCAGGACLI